MTYLLDEFEHFFLQVDITDEDLRRTRRDVDCAFARTEKNEDRLIKQEEIMKKEKQKAEKVDAKVSSIVFIDDKTVQSFHIMLCFIYWGVHL